MADDDTLKRPAYAKRSLIELVGGVKPPPNAGAAANNDDADFEPPPKKSDPLPRPGDPYSAHARFQNRLASEQKFIHFIHGTHLCDGFSYHDLRRIKLVPNPLPGQGPMIVLRFIGAVIMEVTISGRNLHDLHYYISEGTMPWVWEQPDGFKATSDHATVITGINFNEMEK